MNAQLLRGPFLYQLVKDSAAEWMKDNAMRLAAALSYYSVFSLAPLLMIAIGIVGWAYGPAAREGMIEAQMTSLLGWKAAEALNALVKNASETSSGATLVGFVILLVGASTVFGQLKDSLDTMWDVASKPGQGIWALVRQRLLTFGMVVVIGFLLLISLVITTVVNSTGHWMEHTLGIPTFLSTALGFIVPVIIEVGLFALVLRVLPSARVRWEYVWVGAVFTAIFFEIGKFALSWYLALSSTTSAFGAAGSVVIVLLWVFYASCILFFGASITEVYARMSGHPIQPEKNAISTRLQCSDNKGGTAPLPPAPVHAEPDPLNPHLIPRPYPSRETLQPLLRQSRRRTRPDLSAPIPPRTVPEHVRALIERLHAHPIAEVGAALGVGLAAGVISRFFEKKERVYTAGEHLRLGAQSAAEEGTRLARQLAGKVPRW